MAHTPASGPPDPPLRELAARRAPHWTPDCWFGFMIEAIPAALEDVDSDDGGSARVHHPAHFLVAVWEPVVAPPLPQLPAGAAIVSGTLGNAAAELLRLCAGAAPIVLLGRDEVNLTAVADLIIAGDRNLGPRYRAALERFAAAERERWRERIAADYTDRDEGYERFKAHLFPGKGA